MSLAVREALYGKLKATAAITSLLSVPEAIFHEQAPAKAEFPYVIFAKSSGVKTRTFGDREAFRREVWMVKAVDRDTSSKTAEQIAAAIDAALDGGSLNVSEKTVVDLVHVGDVDYLEPDGEEQYRHHGARYRVVLT